MPSTQSDDKKAEGSRIAPRKGSCTDDKSTRVPRQNAHDLSARQHERLVGVGEGGNFRKLVKAQGKTHVRKKYQSGGLIGTEIFTAVASSRNRADLDKTMNPQCST